MSAFYFLLDENVDPSLRTALHKQAPGMTVWAVGDPAAPGRGSSDPDILVWCAANNFSLVTNNRASMPVHIGEHIKAGRHVPGIFILNPNMGVSETVGELTLIWGASSPEEYVDLLIYLPIGR